MRRAQSATEFVVLASFMLVVFFLFFAVIQGRIVDLAQYADKKYLQEANEVLVSELTTAQTVYPDYTRTFTLPSASEKIYSVALLDGQEVVTSYRDKEYVTFLPFYVYGEVNGVGEENILYKRDGIVYLTNGSRYSPLAQNTSIISLNIDVEDCLRAYGDSGESNITPPGLQTSCCETFAFDFCS